jgi:hypothetical protein
MESISAAMPKPWRLIWVRRIAGCIARMLQWRQRAISYRL